MNHSDWSKKDLEYIWHPCSQMKDYETLPPIVIERGQGINLYDVDGKRYLDVVSSWWCNLLGHSHPKINQAIKNQLDSLEHVIFANFSHKPAITLCEELMKKMPQGLCKFNFSDNGSGAIESSMKMSFQYHYQTGNRQKVPERRLPRGNPGSPFCGRAGPLFGTLQAPPAGHRAHSRSGLLPLPQGEKTRLLPGGVH